MPAVDIYTDTTAIHNLYPTFSGHLAFDIGANGGMLSRVFAQHFDEVVAVEPADSFDDLIANIPDNVRPVHAAVSDEVGTVKLSRAAKTEGIGEFVTPTDGPIKASWGDYTSDVEVPAITLDSMAEEYGNPDFIKVDVEGHETYVIRGGHKLFAYHSPQLLIEIHDNSYGIEIRALLPGYRWEQFDHEAYAHPSQQGMKSNHYWLVGQR